MRLLRDLVSGIVLVATHFMTVDAVGGGAVFCSSFFPKCTDVGYVTKESLSSIECDGIGGCDVETCCSAATSTPASIADVYLEATRMGRENGIMSTTQEAAAYFYTSLEDRATASAKEMARRLKEGYDKRLNYERDLATRAVTETQQAKADDIKQEEAACEILKLACETEKDLREREAYEREWGANPSHLNNHWPRNDPCFTTRTATNPGVGSCLSRDFSWTFGDNLWDHGTQCGLWTWYHPREESRARAPVLCADGKAKCCSPKI